MMNLSRMKCLLPILKPISKNYRILGSVRFMATIAKVTRETPPSVKAHYTREAYKFINNSTLSDEDKKFAKASLSIERVNELITEKDDDKKIELVKNWVLIETGQRRKKFICDDIVISNDISFFVNPKQSNEPLINMINKRYIVTIKGHNGSGRTSRVFYAIQNQLPSYHCIYVKIPSQYRNAELFWKSFSTSLNEAIFNTTGLESKITDSKSFKKFFTTKEFADKPLVLFLDDFNVILDNLLITTTIIPELRFIAEHPASRTCLHSFVLIGSMEPYRVETKETSLFTNEFISPYFSYEETKSLFLDYQKERNIKFQDGIVEDIFCRTNGNPFLTNFLGQKIDELLLTSKKRVYSFTEWLEFITFNFGKIDPKNELLEYYQVQKLLEKYHNKDDAFFKANLDTFLSQKTPLPIPHDITTAKYLRYITNLYQHGVITQILMPGEKYDAKKSSVPRYYLISSYILRSLLLKSLIPKKPILLPDTTTLKSEDKDSFNFREVILKGIRYFDPKIMELELKPGQPLASAKYAFQLFQVLREWISGSPQWSITIDVNSDYDRNDFVVSYNEHDPATRERYVIEIISLTNLEKLDEHLANVKSFYSQFTNVKEIWVANFTLQNPPKTLRDSNSDIQTVHVFHDPNWQSAKAIFSTHPSRILNIPLTSYSSPVIDKLRGNANHFAKPFPHKR